MARKLDRTRDYGEIYGASNGARYEQDGVQFGALGDALDDTQEEDVKAKRGRPRKPVETLPPEVPPTVTLSVEEQIKSQLGEE